MKSKPTKRFDQEKAIEVIKFIAQHAPKPDIYWVLKILYFADKLHLQRYGRLICGDGYVAMKHGPVPSGTYQLLREAREYNALPEFHPAPGEIEIQNENTVIPLKEPNHDFFSDSDIECLKESIRKYGRLTFGKLRETSHDAAYKAADENDFMDLEKIVGTLPNANAVLEHIRDCSHV
jgi:uncharacterized phage-associated protein